ncbi:MAG: hypothetical protein ACXWEM_06440, partial [Halobacteriota archaeon]
ATGRDNVAAQSSAQTASITQTQATGAITGNNNTINFGDQDATLRQNNDQYSLQLKNVEINPAIIFGANNTGTQIAPVFS